MILNKTNIKTNEHYHINDINLDIVFQNKSFSNVYINTNYNKKSLINSLTYGVGIPIKNINSNIKLETKSNKLSIIYEFDKENNYLNNILEIDINNDVDIDIVYISKDSVKHTHYGIIKLNTTKNIKANINIINLMNNLSDYLESVEAHILDNSLLNIKNIDLGAKNSINNLYLNNIGDNSKGIVDTMYMANNDEIKDINYITHLRGKKSIIDLNINGTVDNNATKNFKGTIDFKKGCIGSSGKENEYCISFSDDAISKAMPVLLCTEEDVEGAHSASTGEIDKDKLYYIESRGFNEKEAIKLLVKAQFHSIIDNIDDKYKDLINNEIDRRLI